MSPSAVGRALTWELARRHRWGLGAIALYLAALAAIRVLVFEPGWRPSPDDWRFSLAVVVPLAASFAYLVAMFSYGLDGDLLSRRSLYPAQKLTLPLTSAALAGWPMTVGAAAAATLWLSTRLVAVWPAGSEVPWLWPALFAAVILAWTQALVWMPYPFRGLRAIVAVAWLTLIAFAAILALELGASEIVMLALLLPHLPLAHLVARSGVVRARRGDEPDWQGPIGRWPAAAVAARPSFSSPRRAQAWFEWVRIGRALPSMVALALPFELALLLVFRNTPVLLRETIAAVLLTPPFLAAFAAATVMRSTASGSDAYELTSFPATRPLGDASLAGARLEATVRSTLVAWLLLLPTLVLALQLTGTWSVVVDAARRLSAVAGPPRAIAIGMLGLAALVTATWKQLVHALFIGLAGRAWLVKGSVFGTLALLTLLVTLAPWLLESRRAIAAIFEALPWVLAGAVGCKVAAAAWVALRLRRERLLGDRALIAGVLCWNVAVFALYGVLLWLTPRVIFHRHLLLLAATLAVPIARPAATPLALAWNRHR